MLSQCVLSIRMRLTRPKPAAGIGFDPFPSSFRIAQYENRRRLNTDSANAGGPVDLAGCLAAVPLDSFPWKSTSCGSRSALNAFHWTASHCNAVRATSHVVRRNILGVCLTIEAESRTGHSRARTIRSGAGTPSIDDSDAAAVRLQVEDRHETSASIRRRRASVVSETDPGALTTSMDS